MHIIQQLFTIGFNSMHQCKQQLLFRYCDKEQNKYLLRQHGNIIRLLEQLEYKRLQR